MFLSNIYVIKHSILYIHCLLSQRLRFDFTFYLMFCVHSIIISVLLTLCGFVQSIYTIGVKTEFFTILVFSKTGKKTTNCLISIDNSGCCIVCMS